MNDRLKKLRKFLCLTQEEFAKNIELKTSNAISMIERGENALTDQNIKLICSKWNVNEEWLRTGDGEIFQEAESLAADETKLIEIYRALLPENKKFAVKTIEGLLETQQALAGQAPAPPAGYPPLPDGGGLEKERTAGGRAAG
jgi:transcriptional regulator with XRE-family HTH domain